MKKITSFIRKSLLFTVCLLVIFPLSTVSASDDFFSDSEIQLFDKDACDPNGGVQASSEPSTNGGDIYIVGDSITKLAENEYKKKFTSPWNLTLNGLVSRHIKNDPPSPSGIDQITQDEEIIKSAEVVVVALGTNDSGNSGDSIESDVKKTVKKIQSFNSTAQIFWVNIINTKKDGESKKTNNAITNGIGSDVKVINWYKKAKEEADTGSFDLGVHPTKSSDITLLVDTVFSAVGENNSPSSSSSQQTNSCVCSSGGSTTTLSGSDNEEKVWNYFIGKGLNGKQTAGIMGNISQESGFDPENIQDPAGRTKDPSSISAGWGLIQWTPGSKIYTAAEKGKIKGPIYELATQLDIIWYQLNNYAPPSGSGVINEFKKRSTSPSAAAVAWENLMEAAGSPALENRKRAAEAAYVKYGGSEASGGSTSSGSSECSGSTGGANGFELNQMKVFDQCDPKWANEEYGEGKSPICEGGCGITSMAMVVATLKDSSQTPKTMSDKYGDRFHGSSGTDWGLWPVAARDFGLKYKDLGVDLNKAKDIIKSGGMVIISVNAGEFTSGGHLMVIRAVDDEGNFYLADPNYKGNKGKGKDTNNKAYSADFLKNQGALKHLWGFSK